MRISLALPLLIAALFCHPAKSDNWPQWRGPTHDGHSTESHVPVTWSATQNILWKTPIPGNGHSSPIIFGDKIFLTTAIEAEGKRLLLCLDRRDGHVLWQQVLFTATLEHKHTLNNYASSTPATDGKRLFVTFLDYPNLRVFCFNLDGKKLWDESPGEFHSTHGWGASPILYKDSVIINGDQDAPAYLVALDQATGEEKWRVDRPNRTRSYCTPLIVNTPDGRTQMVLTGSKSVASYNPDTGAQYWLVDGPTEQFVASPVYTDNTVVITGGFPTFHLLGIDPTASGTLTEADHVLWHLKGSAASYVPSLIADGKYAFCVSDNGLCTCLEAKTGKRLWSHQLGKHHRPSPVWAEGHLYYVADNGDTFVLQSAGEYQLLSKNSLGENCFASPAVSNGQLFIRSVSTLFCIGNR